MLAKHLSILAIAFLASTSLANHTSRPLKDYQTTKSLSGFDPVIYYDYNRSAYFVCKTRPSKDDLYDRLQDPASSWIFSRDAQIPNNEKVTLYVVDANQKLITATIKGTVVKDDSKIPDSLSKAFGGASAPVAAITPAGAHITPAPQTFAEWVLDFKGVAKQIDSTEGDFVASIKEALAKSDTFEQLEDRMDTITAPDRAAKDLDKKKLESDAKQIESKVNIVYPDDPTPQAAKDAILQAVEATVKSEEDTLTAFDSGADIYEGTKTNHSYFAKGFVSKPDIETASGVGLNFDIGLKDSQGNELTPAPSLTLNSTPAIHFAFSTGLSSFDVRNGSYGKSPQLDPITHQPTGNLIISKKGSQHENVVSPTAFVHMLFPVRHNLAFGPSFGIGARDKLTDYFFGLTLSAGDSQKLFITAGIFEAPSKTLDGVSVGDVIGAATTIPTKTVNKTGPFIAISFKF